jgi:hypothetical protein
LDSFALPGVAGQLAYKELKASLPQNVRDEAVRSMCSAVAFRDSLPGPDRADLDEYTTWPVAIVENQGRPEGLLMPLIPPDFFMPVNPPGGQPGSIVRELSFLATSDAYAAAMGFDLSTANDGLVRLALAAQLSYAVARLHKHGIVYGDLSLHNAAVAINPARIKLLDCDAAASTADTGRKQLHSPFFAPPENASGAQKLQDDKTDVYKLALCILRMLVRGKGVTQLTDPTALQGILDQEGLELLAKALSNDRTRRPSAKQLFEHLKLTVVHRAQPPVLRAAGINRSFMLRGQDVTVSWQATGATRLRILGPNGLEMSISRPDSFPQGYAVTPSGSGAIVVEVENAHGTDSVVAGAVDLFDLPTFKFPMSVLPHPEVPNLPDVATPSAPFPPRPVASVDSHPVPQIEVPSMDSALEAVRAPLMSPPPFEGITRAVADSTAGLRVVLDIDHPHAGTQIALALENSARTAGDRIQRMIGNFPLP